MKRLNNKRRRIATPTLSARNDGQNKTKGFTLVELVITIAIVIILSVISVPIYRGYVDKAKWSEGYAVLGTILSAQKAYYSEYGNFYIMNYTGDDSTTSYEPVLGIDVRGNKYFTLLTGATENAGLYKHYFCAAILEPGELKNSNNKKWFRIKYDITSGSVIHEVN